MTTSTRQGDRTRPEASDVILKAARVALFVGGVLSGLAVGGFTFWLAPLHLVAAVGVAVAAVTVPRGGRLRSYLWGCALGATLPFLLGQLSALT